MIGGCCRCGYGIQGVVSYSQHCHDLCYIASMSDEMLDCWIKGGVIAERHMEFANKMLALTQEERLSYKAN